MLISEVMTHQVVTADVGATLADVAGLMRDRNVGSVVICDGERAVGVLTDRDIALLVVADGVGPEVPAGEQASRPIVAGDAGMELEEAAQLMIENRIRRLPLLDGEALVGIVTIDDVAVRAGDLQIAQRMTAEVAKQALPEFFFHQRGG